MDGQPYDHWAYRPWSLATIKPIHHRAFRSSSLSTIKPIDYQAYQPLTLSTIEPINHQAYQPCGLLLQLLSLLLILSLILIVSDESNLKLFLKVFLIVNIPVVVLIGCCFQSWNILYTSIKEKVKDAITITIQNSLTKFLVEDMKLRPPIDDLSKNSLKSSIINLNWNTVVAKRVRYFLLINNSYKNWSIIKSKDSFGICTSWGFQNCPWKLNLIKIWLRKSR